VRIWTCVCVCFRTRHGASTSHIRNTAAHTPLHSLVVAEDYQRRYCCKRCAPGYSVWNSVQSYTVYYTNDSHLPLTQWQQVNVTGTQDNVLIEHLQPNTMYYYRVQAISERGAGLPSQLQQIKTGSAGRGTHSCVWRRV
jgi:hypothetical protein